MNFTRSNDYVDAAEPVVLSVEGAGALDALTWWDMVADLGDRDAAEAVFATLRAQGRRLSNTPALGALVAQPYLEVIGEAPGTAIAALAHDNGRGERRWLVLGDAADRSLLFDVDGEGVFVVSGELDGVDLEVPGGLSVRSVAFDPAAHTPVISGSAVADVRRRSLALGRLGAASEILGAAEQVVTLAVEYAELREQFGRPIGTFQALRHVLAWAATDCVALDAAVRRGIDVRNDPPDRFDAALKALAGRNGRRACDRALQTFGGIGFTKEHPHHLFHRRVLLIDAVLGSTAELTHQLGTWLRTSGTDPRFASSVLAECLADPVIGAVA